MVFAVVQLTRAETAPAAEVSQIWTPAALSTPGAGPTSAASPVKKSQSTTSGVTAPLWPAHPATPQTQKQTVGVPSRLLIARVGVEMPVVSTTISKGEMTMPDHPSSIGWYAYGPRPGATTGAAVLAGHVDSWQYGTGPLVRLKSLRRGDRIVVVSAKARLTFRVTAVQLVAKHTPAVDEIFDRTGPGRLEIVTCGGAFLPKQGGYQDNVVVTAIRAKG